ncbi:hypothetical protein AAY53_06425 [Vibrio metoecus]|uniref:Uncharacterized protein n=1 Tax=Vibrio metoecus TaxID=1481663 RepID=A0A0Q0PSE2_VIBMT|nr:hypothetical protein AAY55_12605 [Vibrio metoecus]KQA27361.1 hypothetical protein AAY53_06425 [Vibrio metoecus]
MTCFYPKVNKPVAEMVGFGCQHWLNAGECIGVKTALRTEEFLFIRRNEKFVVLTEWAAFDGFFYSWVIHLLILSSKKSVYVASC